MSGELKHIFDKSACLSRRQLRDYVSGHMANEECHTVEHHLNDCPLCSAAVDGMLVNTEKALETVAELNTDFLKEHFGLNNPEVHLNSMSPAEAIAPQMPQAAKAKIKVNIQPLWRKASIAAAILLAFGLFWYMRSGSGQNEVKNNVIAQKPDNETTVPPPQNENVKADKPAAESAVAVNEPPAVAPAPAPAAETETKPVQNAAAGAAKPAEDAKLAAKTADAKKTKEETKPAALAAVTAAPADKKALQEKAKVAADLKKKNDAKTALVKSGNANNKTAGKDENRAVAQTAAADRHEAFKAAEAPPHANATPVAHTEAAASASQATGKAANEDASDDKQDKGRYFFDKQQWNDALKVYKVEINNSSKAKRHQASYMAAQCYIKMGNNKEAERLLKIVVDEGGKEKRHAKKLLESISEKNAEKK